MSPVALKHQCSTNLHMLTAVSNVTVTSVTLSQAKQLTTFFQLNVLILQPKFYFVHT